MFWELVGFWPMARAAMHSAASPAPKVFTAYNGFEVFSSKFFLEFADGVLVGITPENYSKIKGPFNRRNTYGSTITYSPFIKGSEQLYRTLNFGFCGDAPILKEMELERMGEPRALVVETKFDDRYRFELCS